MNKNILIRITGLVSFILYLLLIKFNKSNTAIQYAAICITFICFIYLSYIAISKFLYYIKLFLISLSDQSNNE